MQTFKTKTHEETRVRKMAKLRLIVYCLSIIVVLSLVVNVYQWNENRAITERASENWKCQLC